MAALGPRSGYLRGDGDHLRGSGALSIELPHISSTASLFAPGLTVDIDLGSIDSESVLYPIELSLDLSLPFIAATTVVNQPSLTRDIDLSFIASGETLYPPLLTQDITLDFISHSHTFGITLDRDLSLPFISSGDTLYTPGVTLSLGLSFISSGEVLYEPTVVTQKVITLTFLDETTVFPQDVFREHIVNLTFLGGGPIHAVELANSYKAPDLTDSPGKHSEVFQYHSRSVKGLRRF